MLRVTSRQRLVSWDAFDATDRASESSPSLVEDISEPSFADDSEGHQSKMLVGKKRDRCNSSTESPNSPQRKQDAKASSETKDTNLKKSIMKSTSFTELVKLSSARVAPQAIFDTEETSMHPVQNPPSSRVAATIPAFSTVESNVIPPDHPSARAEFDANNADDDDEYGFTFPLDEEESVNDDNAQSYETLVAGVVELHRSHYERAISFGSSPEEGSTQAPTSFKTTANPCCEEKPELERSLLTWENSTVNMLTLLDCKENGTKSLSPPLPSISDIGLVDLMDDAILHSLSYLTSTDIRSVSVTCRDMRSLITAPGAAQHFWMNICQRESWGSSLPILSRCSDGVETRRVIFRDNLSIPFAGIAKGNKNINLSVLLGLTANSYPTAIDPAFFQNNVGRRTRYSVYRRPPEFRTYPITCNPAQLKMRRPDYDGEEVGKFGNDTLTVVQFTSRCGLGDRCIKSDQPFPRLVNNISHKYRSTCRWSMKRRHNDRSPSPSRGNSSSHGRRFTTFRRTLSPTSFVLDFLCRGTPVLPPPEQPFMDPSELASYNDSVNVPPPVTVKTTSATSTMRPFVVPRVVSEIGDTVEVDVTPCLVAYFEVTILPRQESQEPPLPGVAASHAVPQSRAAAADAAARAHIALATSHEHHQRVAAARAFREALAVLEDNQAQNDNATNTGVIPPPAASHKDCVAIGLSTASFATQRKMPGWDEQSYGYHGDDGGIFHDGGEMIRKFGPTFGVYDTVGCGIDYNTKSIFFTRNGEFLGFAFADLDDPVLEGGLYPTVGVDTNYPLFVNFGEKPFEFNLRPFRKWYGDALDDGLSGLLPPLEKRSSFLSPGST